MKKVNFNNIFKVPLIGFIFIFLYFSGAKMPPEKSSSPKLVFPVISDTHIGGTGSSYKFKAALREFKELYPDYDAIAIVGDIVNSSNVSNYTEFMDILNSEKNSNSEMIITMGNHEYYNGNLSNKTYEDRFIKNTGVTSLYYAKNIKDYLFIALAPENKESAHLSDKQLNWLSNTLEGHNDKSKPIFVFIHQPFRDTVFGSNSCSNIDDEIKLYSIFKKYPQIVLFSGHSHYSLEESKIEDKDGFNMINTGAIYYVLNTDKSHEPIYSSQGLVAEVYEDEIIIKYREILTHKWIGKKHIPIKSNKTPIIYHQTGG